MRKSKTNKKLAGGGAAGTPPVARDTKAPRPRSEVKLPRKQRVDVEAYVGGKPATGRGRI